MGRSVSLMQVLLLALVFADVAESRLLGATHGRIEESPTTPEAESKSIKMDPRKMDKNHPHYEGRMERVKHEKEEDMEAGKIKYPVLNFMHHKLKVIFAKSSDSWWMDWKLWVGLPLWCGVWAIWLRHGYDENNEVYYQRSLFVFGVNILILHILEYAESIKSGMLVVCLVLAAQNIFQNYLSFKTQNDDFVTPRAESFNCDTVYLDFTLPFEQIVILFVAQCGIWWFYMTSILGNFDFEQVNYLFWVWAFLSMQITMIFNRGEDSVLGNAFPVHDIYRLVLKTDNVLLSLDADGDKADQFKMSKFNIIARGVMGFVCNSILREIMSYTIPLMLMGFSEPMDFVVYCVGVNFICTLDDMSDKKFALSWKEGTEAVRD